jgi:hypothetical protein
VKTISAFLISALLSALSLWLLPWWCSGIIACITMFLLRIAPARGLLAGFFGVGLAWGVVAGWIDAENAGILSSKIGTLFMGLSSFALVLITGLIGGISGALGGITGALIRQAQSYQAVQSQ